MWAFKIRQLGRVCIKNDQVYLLFAFSFALADILFAAFVSLYVWCYKSVLAVALVVSRA